MEWVSTKATTTLSSSFNVSIVWISNECFMWFRMYPFFCLPLALTVHLLKICVFFLYFSPAFIQFRCPALHSPSLFHFTPLICSERFITYIGYGVRKRRGTKKREREKRWKESRSTRCEKCLLWKLIWCVNTHDDCWKKERKNGQKTTTYTHQLKRKEKNMINKLKCGRFQDFFFYAHGIGCREFAKKRNEKNMQCKYVGIAKYMTRNITFVSV